MKPPRWADLIRERVVAVGVTVAALALIGTASAFPSISSALTGSPRPDPVSSTIQKCDKIAANIRSDSKDIEEDRGDISEDQGHVDRDQSSNSTTLSPSDRRDVQRHHAAHESDLSEDREDLADDQQDLAKAQQAFQSAGCSGYTSGSSSTATD